MNGGYDYEKLPLVQAVRFAPLEQVIEMLEKVDVKTEAVDPTTKATVLFFAAQRPNDEESVKIAKLLIETFKVCDPNQKDRMNQTCLFYSARDGNSQLCEYLVQQGCDPNIRDNHLQTCLFYAAREGQTESLVRLIRLGANPNLADLNGQTAVFYAAREGKLETVKAILENGANPAVKDKYRRTAMTFARQGGHLEVANLLKNALPVSKMIFSRAMTNSSSSSGVSVISPISSLSPNAEQKKQATSQEIPEIAPSNQESVVDYFNSQNNVSYSKSTMTTDNTRCEANSSRKRYRLQYKLPLNWESIWVDAPLVKVEEFERLFPDIAVWPRDKPVYIPEPSADPLKKEWVAAALNLVQDLSKYEGGHIFEKLVDAKKNNCSDYYEIIKEPISFSCIRSKLKKYKYDRVTDFISDINLLFNNCRLYNKSNSWVTLVSTQLEKYFINQTTVRMFDSYIQKQNQVDLELLKVADENRLYAQKQSSLKQDGKNSTIDEDKSLKSSPNLTYSCALSQHLDTGDSKPEQHCSMEIMINVENSCIQKDPNESDCTTQACNAENSTFSEPIECTKNYSLESVENGTKMDDKGSYADSNGYSNNQFTPLAKEIVRNAFVYDISSDPKSTSSI